MTNAPQVANRGDGGARSAAHRRAAPDWQHSWMAFVGAVNFGPAGASYLPPPNKLGLFFRSPTLVSEWVQRVADSSPSVLHRTMYSTGRTLPMENQAQGPATCLPRGSPRVMGGEVTSNSDLGPWRQTGARGFLRMPGRNNRRRIQIYGTWNRIRVVRPESTPVLTPGGRFAKDSPGLPELARPWPAGSSRVLLWDRPNCGASDISFEAESESALPAHTLIELIRALELNPGRRLWLPDRAVSQGISDRRRARSRGGFAFDRVVDQRRSSEFDFARGFYCVGSAIAASRGGMAAVAVRRVGPNKSSAIQESRDSARARPAAFH